MAVYRDSQLGLCLDIRGPDGNIFFILAAAENLASQIGNLEEWRTAVKAMRLMGANYMSHLFLFREFFPIITIIGWEEIAEIHGVVDEVLEMD